MIIKGLLVASTLIVAYYALYGRGGRQLALRRLAGTALAVAGVLAVLWPDAVTWVAHLVGVGRGTDLLLYVAVVTFAFVSASLYTKVKELESHVTALVREHALSHPRSTGRD